MSKKKTAAVVLGSAVVSLAGIFGAVLAVNTLLDNQKTEQYTISEPIHKLVVGTGAGNVDIVATAADQISVRQTTHWITDEPSPKRNISGGVLTLADADDCGGWTLLRCETDYRIEVPRDLVVSVRVDAGDISVTGLAGKLTVESDAGNVDGTALGASHVKASSDAGDVNLAFSVAPTSVEAESDAGNVEIDLPRDEYAVSVDTDAGGSSVEGIIRYDLAPHVVKAETDAGDVRIRGR